MELLATLLCFLVSFTIAFNGAIASSVPKLHALSFEEGYTQIFGDGNLMLLQDGQRVHIALDERTGAGFASQDLYLHGYFSASIKLPSDYAAGVVVAFYMSNGDEFEKTHDELDFEFLGNIRSREWRVQTNVYANGSTSVGREEKYEFWFDPTEDFHQYSILWSHERIIFYIDAIPIREIVKSDGGAFPSKPMSLYATIWDGSTWATTGGRYKVNYKYAPYIAEFKDLVLHGCSVNPIDHSPTCQSSDVAALYDSVTISNEERMKMSNIRRRYITYSYCYDRERYHFVLPECKIDPTGAQGSYGQDGVRIGTRRHRRKQTRESRKPKDTTNAALLML